MSKTVVHSLAFTEEMKGHFSKNPSTSENNNNNTFNKDVFVKASEGSDLDLAFHLTIEIDDVDKFVRDPEHTGRCVGKVICSDLGGELEVEKGTFNLFTRKEASTSFDTVREMHYTLYFKDRDGNPYTFFGYKEVEREDGLEAWKETTTLYTYLWKGHSEFDSTSKEIYGLGLLTLTMEDFAKQLTTFKIEGGCFTERTSTLIKFIKLFAGSLWEAYAPFIFGTDSKRWNEHIFPVNTLSGVKDCEKTTHWIDTEDGLSLTMQRFKRSESKNVVLLLHGLTTSTDMFIMPEHYNLTQYLLDNDYEDVWSFDWRGSGRFKYNLEPHRYNVDDIAAYDMPKAIEEIRAHVGEDAKIHVICHCVGSLAFMCSTAAGWIKGVDSIISNSVSLTPNVGKIAKLKLFFAPDVVEHIFGYPYISPKIPYFPGPGFGKWIFWMERMLRRECKEPACHMISFMWGWGFPVAYLHKNLSPITHRRLVDLFGGTAVHYFRHLRKMIFNKAALPYDKKKHPVDLPDNYFENTKEVELPPLLLVSGSKNLVFPSSNKITYERLKQIRPDANVDYQEFAEYGHQDVFMGKNCDKDIFPSFLEFLKKHSA